jgi:hypothetical protein
MRLSREKINHLSRLLVESLQGDGEVTFLRPPNDVRLHIVRVITDEVRIDEGIDEDVVRTLQSYKRKIPAGSPEWEILYRKHYEEELVRRGLK